MFQLDTVKLRGLLFEKKISAARLAQSANLTLKTVGKLLKGGRANALTIGKLAAALDVDGEQLIMKEM